MGEIEKLLRLQTPAMNEYRVTPVTASGEQDGVAASGQVFSTQLSGGQGRTGLFVYNKSDSGSGEAFFGATGVLPATGFPLPVGSLIEIPVAPAVGDPYFVCSSGELADLRILEIA
jgi:hypothetical protein